MSIEVASLHATLGIKTEGLQQAQRYTQQLASAEEALSKAAGSSSASVNKLADDLRAAVARANELGNATAAMDAELSKLGSSVLNLDRDINRLTGDINKQAQAVAAAEAKQRQATTAQREADLAVRKATAQYGLLTTEYNSARTAQKAAQEVTRAATAEWKAQNQTLVNLTRTQQTLKGVQQGLSQIPIVETKAVATVEQLTTRLNKLNGVATQTASTMQKVGGGTGGGAGGFLTGNGAQSRMSGIFSSMMSGNITSTLLSQSLFAVGGAFAAIALPIGAAIIGIQKFISTVVGLFNELRSLHDSFAGVSEGAITMARTLRTVEGISLSELAGQLDLIANRVKSFGGSAGTTPGIARMGEAFAALAPGLNDTAKYIDIVARGVETLNFEGLRDASVNVSALNEGMAALAGQGKAVQAEFARVFLNNEIARNIGKINEQLDQERSTFKSLGEQVSKWWNQLMALEPVRQIFDDLVNSLRGMLVALKPVIVGFGVGLVVSIKIATMAMQGFLIVTEKFLRLAAGAADFLGMDGMAKGLRSVADEMKRATDGTSQWSGILAQAGEGWDSFNRGAGEAVDRLARFRDQVQGGFSIVDSFKALGSSWDVLQEGITGPAVFDHIQNLDNAMGLLAEHGTESLDKLQQKVASMFSAGLIDSATYNKLTEGFDVVRDAAGPLLDEVKRVESAYKDNKSAAQDTAGMMQGSLTPSIQGVGSMASFAAGQVNNLSAALRNVPSSVNVGINVVGGGTIVGGGFRGGGPPRRGGTGPGAATINPELSGIGSRTMGTVGTPVFSPEMGRGIQERDNQRRREMERNADFWRPPSAPKTGGGGGGGGSGAKDPLANIDEIRELFRQINKAILTGINGGVMFSAAGNSIPAGGINEFLNTKGGTLIQTVNIRGIWDFADPASKRLIIKEMEEAIRNLKREK